MQITDSSRPLLITEREVAAMTHLSLATIRRRRAMHLDPHPIRIDRAVRYRTETVLRWLDALEGSRI